MYGKTVSAHIMNSRPSPFVMSSTNNACCRPGANTQLLQLSIRHLPFSYSTCVIRCADFDFYIILELVIQKLAIALTKNDPSLK